MKQSCSDKRPLSVFCFIAFLLATISTPMADSLVAPSFFSLRTTRLQNNNNVALLANNAESNEEECGEGFLKQTGPDGEYCEFDFDAAANAFGTDAEHVKGEEYWEAMNSQNKARLKFGMEPLTPQEYVALQAQVHQMDIQLIADATKKAFAEFDTNQDGVITVEELKEGLEKVLRTELTEKQVEQIMIHFDASGDGLLQLDEFVTIDTFRTKVDAVITTEEESSKEQDEEESTRPSILQNFMNNMFQDTCESNYDCERPEVCCDFHYKKMCCSSGQMAKELQLEYATVPVPMASSEHEYM